MKKKVIIGFLIVLLIIIIAFIKLNNQKCHTTKEIGFDVRILDDSKKVIELKRNDKISEDLNNLELVIVGDGNLLENDSFVYDPSNIEWRKSKSVGNIILNNSYTEIEFAVSYNGEVSFEFPKIDMDNKEIQKIEFIIGRCVIL